MLKTRSELQSQNFLKGHGLVTRLIRASGISWKDNVLEIGAGKGLITESLLAVSQKVLAVEIDESLYLLVFNRLGSNPNLTLIQGNFLDIVLPKEPYKVFANIPFSITGEIIKKLLLADNPPLTCDLVVQKEAAEKFVFGKSANSMLSVLFYPWFDIQVGHIFKRSDFQPVPKVDLCILRITKRVVPLIPFNNIERYRDFVVFMFTKRKGVNRWPREKWLGLYLRDVHCRGSYAKWQNEQKKITKIHRTRTNKDWKSRKFINCAQ